MSHFRIARTFALVLPFCFGCAAQAEDPLGSDVGGSSSSTGGAAGNATSSGGSSNTGGTPSTGGVATGGAATGGAATGGATATGGSGTGGTTHVNTDLPYTENWDDGDMAGWIASDATLAGNFSVIDSDLVKSMQFNSGNGECVMAGGNLAWTDIHVTLKFKIVSGNPTFVVAARLTGPKTYYYIEIGNNHFKIRDRNNGGSDLLPTGDDPPLTIGQWYTLDFVAQGSTLTGSLDGTVIATGTMDSTTPIVNGGIGLGARSGSAGVVLFDDIQVTAAP